MLSGATGQRFGCSSSDSTARSRPLNQRAPCCGARPTTHQYSSSRSASARRAISTRYAMLAAQLVEHLPRRLGAAGLHVRKAVLNPFDRFDPVEPRLVGPGILDPPLDILLDVLDQARARH